MTEYIISKKSEYKTFDDILDLLEDGDIVTFQRGLHTFKGGTLKINNLTLRGEGDKAYEKTFLVMLPNKDGTPKIQVTENGGLNIQLLSILSAPNVQPFVFENNTNLLVTESNIAWNHYKLKSLDENLNLISSLHPTDFFNTVDISKSIIGSIDAVAKKIVLNNTFIGSPYGDTSFLSGFAQDSAKNFFSNIDLGLVGELYSVNIINDVQLVDTHEDLYQYYPNLRDTDLIINNLLFKHRNQKALKIANTWDPIAEKLYQKSLVERFGKGKNKLPEYYLINERTESPVYVNMDLKSKGFKNSRYPIPHDKSLINNKGKLVLRGVNTAKTTWPNVQEDGELILIDYTTGIPFEYLGGLVSIINSDVAPYKNVEFTETSEKPDISPDLPVFDRERISNVLISQSELDAIEARKTPIYDTLKLSLGTWIQKHEKLPILLIESDDFDNVKRQVKMHTITLTNRNILTSDAVIKISNKSLQTRSPKDLKDTLKKRIGETWILEDAGTLLNNAKAKDWITFLLGASNFKKRPTLLVFQDTYSNLESLLNAFPQLNEHVEIIKKK